MLLDVLEFIQCLSVFDEIQRQPQHFLRNKAGFSSPIGSMVLLYMVIYGNIYHQYTPFMESHIYQHHGSVMGQGKSQIANRSRGKIAKARRCICSATVPRLRWIASEKKQKHWDIWGCLS